MLCILVLFVLTGCTTSEIEYETSRDEVIYSPSKLVELCDMYQQKCPNEYKLEFDVATHKFDASYRYDDYTKSGISPVSELMSWYGEIKESM